MLRFCSLGSGSSGNATLVEGRPPDGRRPTRLLIDCGLGLRQLAARLAVRGLSPGDIDAVFVTHEHSDHVAGVLALQRRFGVAVWASAGTWEHVSARAPVRPVSHLAQPGVQIEIGSLRLRPFTVPHDASEPLQLVVGDGRHCIGILTDIGEPTDAVAAALQACDALLLETNHDPDLLAASAYPPWLQRRIAGPRGHLANRQAADLLARCRHDALRHVVAAHLSLRNNHPDLAIGALASALAPGVVGGTRLGVADAQTGCDWIEID